MTGARPPPLTALSALGLAVLAACTLGARAAVEAQGGNVAAAAPGTPASAGFGAAPGGAAVTVTLVRWPYT
jgi:hypothetical protein